MESEKCPPIAAFCESAVRLYTPNLNNLGAKSPIVSGLHLKYSRFLETRAGDGARSALRGVGRSLTQRFSKAIGISGHRSRRLRMKCLTRASECSIRHSKCAPAYVRNVPRLAGSVSRIEYNPASGETCTMKKPS